MNSRRKAERPGIRGWAQDLRGTVQLLYKRTSSAHKVFVLFIVVAGAVLRIVPLFAPVTYAEAFAMVHFVKLPWWEILSERSLPGNHILHTLLLKISTDLFGNGLFAMRLPSLLAGVMVLPMFYVLVRSMFNRYIALLALSLVAASGPLVQWSALATGASLIWFGFISGLLLGRHFVKENNLVSAVLIGVVLAMGMWVDTIMLFGAVAVYIWLVLYLMATYESTLGKRMVRWAISLATFFVLTLILYGPVIIRHGLGQLLGPGGVETGVDDWTRFTTTHPDSAFALWAYFTDSASPVFAVLGFVGILASVYLSTKYRALVVATLFGAIPIVILRMQVGPPADWTYTLFILHLGSAIAVFYLLKLVQEKVFPALSKRVRTVATSLALFVAFALLGRSGTVDHVERFPEARQAVDLLRSSAATPDHVLAEFPWDAPISYHLMHSRSPLSIKRAEVLPLDGDSLIVVVAPDDGQSPELVLRHHKVPLDRVFGMKKVKEWKRLEIFAARFGEQDSNIGAP